METLQTIYAGAIHNRLIQLVVIAIVCDTFFGVLRAIKEKKFNSCFGINGAIRKVAMIFTLIFMVVVDSLIDINLIGFIPEKAREAINIERVGITEFFALLYLCYEAVSILKNMVLCGLPFKKVWEKLRTALGKYTNELPDADEIVDNDSSGNNEAAATQENETKEE